MDSRQHRILKASIYELMELHREAIQTNQLGYAGSLLPILAERKIRFERGQLYARPDNAGVDEDTSGDE